MTILDSLALSLQPVAQQLVEQFGVRANVRPRTLTTYAPDGSKAESWTVDATGVGLPVILEPLTAATAQRLYGQKTNVTARLFFPTVNGARPQINTRDAIRITTGPYAGTAWLAEAEGIADGAGVMTTVPVSAAPTQVTIP